MYNASRYKGGILLVPTGSIYMAPGPQQEKKDAVFQIRMRPSVKVAGEKAARDQNRSLSSLMETLLIAHLRQTGYLRQRKS